MTKVKIHKKPLFHQLQKVFFGLLAMTLFACSDENPKSDRSPKLSLDYFWSNYNKDDKLLMNARFSECGEWGGHEEKITISQGIDRELYLEYKKFKVNCDSVNPDTGQPIQVPDLIKRLQLTPDYKYAISNYILRTTKSKLNERFVTGGYNFSIMKSDCTLVLNIIGIKADADSYYQLLSELSLDPH